MTNENKLKFPVQIGDYVTINDNGKDSDLPLPSVCKVIGQTTFFGRNAYVCSSGTLLVSVNFAEDGLYCDARLGMLGPWYSVPDEHRLSIEKAKYKRQIVEASTLVDAQIDQVYELLKEHHSGHGLGLRSFIF